MLYAIAYKTNIQPLAHALEKVMALRGVRYDWRTTEFPEMRFDQGAQLGFVAQEIKDVLPEVVSQDSQGPDTESDALYLAKFPVLPMG